MSVRSVLLVLAVLLSTTFPAKTGSNLAPLHEALSAFEKEHQSMHGKGLSSIEKAHIVESSFSRITNIIGIHPHLDHLDDETLKSYFDATYAASFYTMNDAHAAELQRVFNELQNRGKSTQDEQRRLYEMLIATRNFQAAEFLKKDSTYLAVNYLPKTRGVTSRTRLGVWDLSNDQTTLFYRNVSLEKYKLVVVAHPLCHFSQDAIRSIRKSPDLYRFFAKNALFVIPQEGDLNSEAISRWNSANPAFRMVLVDKQYSWPEYFTEWSTPVFYFIHDGKLVDSVIGWPPAGNAQALRNAIQQIESLH